MRKHKSKREKSNKREIPYQTDFVRARKADFDILAHFLRSMWGNSETCKHMPGKQLLPQNATECPCKNPLCSQEGRDIVSGIGHLPELLSKQACEEARQLLNEIDEGSANAHKAASQLDTQPMMDKVVEKLAGGLSLSTPLPKRWELSIGLRGSLETALKKLCALALPRSAVLSAIEGWQQGNYAAKQEEKVRLEVDKEELGALREQLANTQKDRDEATDKFRASIAAVERGEDKLLVERGMATEKLRSAVKTVAKLRDELKEAESWKRQLKEARLKGARAEASMRSSQHECERLKKREGPNNNLKVLETLQKTSTELEKTKDIVGRLEKELLQVKNDAAIQKMRFRELWACKKGKCACGENG